MTSATVIAPAPGAADLRRPVLVRTIWLLVGIVVLVVLSILSISFGVRAVSFDDIAAALTGRTDTIAEAAIVKRIPRTVLALLVGAALALSGATMQAVTRNPIADPGILGVSNGASLAVVCGIAFFGLADPYGQMAFAIAGAGIAAVFVYTVGSLGRGGGATPLKLALAGAATSAAFASLISAVMLLASICCRRSSPGRSAASVGRSGRASPSRHPSSPSAPSSASSAPGG